MTIMIIMKKTILFCVLCIVVVKCHAQLGYNCMGEFIKLYVDRENAVLYIQPNYKCKVDINETISKLSSNNIQKVSKNGYLVYNSDRDKITKEIYTSDAYISTYGNDLFILPRIIISANDKDVVKRIINESNGELFLDVAFDNIFKLNCNVDNSEGVLRLISKISEYEGVNWCEPSKLSKLVFDNTYYEQQYYLKNTGQNGETVGYDINVEPAWNITEGSEDVIVAVIDNGVDKNHEDMGNRVLNGYTIGDTLGIGIPLNDYDAHGMSCAGIIAASNNSIGIRGIASNVNILPINIGAGSNISVTDEDVADAIRWAYQNDADILSCSWHINHPPSPYLISTISNARSLGRNGKGTIVVFASGNGYETDSVYYPARLDGVIAVGAIKGDGTIWDYSNRGYGLNLVAPSGGGNIVTTDRMGALGVDVGNYRFNFGGTSAACPQVAGVAALILSVAPYLTETQVRETLQSTAYDLGASGFDNTYGYGLVDAYAAVNAVSMHIEGTPTICNSAVYNVENLKEGMNVIWSLDDLYYFMSYTLFKPNYPSTNQCYIRCDKNHNLNGTLTAQVYQNGVLIKTLTRFVRTIPEFECTIAATGAPSSYIFPAYLTSGMRVNVPCNSIVTLTSSDFTHMSITKTGNASNYFEVDGSQIHFTIPTTNLGQSITVNGQSQTDCQSFSLTFLASTTPGYWKPKDLDPLDPIDFDSLDLNVYPIGDGLLQIEVVENSSEEKGGSVMQMNKEADSYNWLLEIYKVSNGSKVYSREIECVSYQLNTLGWESGTYVIRAIVRRKEQKSESNMGIINVLTSKIKI